MAKKVYPLASTSEQEIIIKKLLELINSFPDLPKIIKDKGIGFYDLLPNVENMAFASLDSARIFTRYIGGSYIGQYRFRIGYRYSTKNFEERISKQSLLSTIGEWLQKDTITRTDGTTFKLEAYPILDTDKEIISIENIDRTVVIDKNNTGYEDSIIDCILKYHVRKDD